MSAESLRGHTVVVGVDDSESTTAAVVWGAREAARRGTDLALVFAFGKPLLGSLTGSSDTAGPRLAALGVLTRAAAVAQEVAPDLRIHTRLLDGLPVPVLSEAANGADILVVGSHSAGQLSVAVLGSTARTLSVVGPGPLVVVRGPDPETLPEAGVLPVVVGVDGSAHSRRAAHFAAEEARLTHVPLVVAHVDSESRHDTASASLFQSMLTTYPALDMHYRRLSGPTAAALVDCSSAARLLVVGSRGRGGIAGLLGGSVSQALMRRAECPLAVIPPMARIPLGASV